MTNITQLREDFRSGMTIEEVLEKHNIDFPTAMRLMGSYAPRKPKKPRKCKYNSTNEQYIYQVSNKFYIRKTVNGKMKSFGGYHSLAEAIRVRDYLIENGWYKHRLKTVWKKCGVNMED